MKPLAFNPTKRTNSRAAESAFTLVETMMVMGLFLLLVSAMLSSHLFGLKMYNIAQSKLSAADNARETLNRVRTDVRSAKLLYVGNVNNPSASTPTFTAITSANQRIGNAIKVHPTTATNAFILYYWDSTTNSIVRRTNNSTLMRREIIAKYVTNKLVFQAEDCSGKVLTNDVNNLVIKMTLQFRQWEFPISRVGVYYDYYQLTTKIARRAIE